MRSITLIRDVEEHLDCALCDRLCFLRFTELNFITPNVAFLVVEENLVSKTARPRINKVLHNLFSLLLVHLSKIKFKFENFKISTICH